MSPPGPVCKFSCLVIDHLYQRCGGGQTGPRMTFSANKWPVRLFPGSSIIQLLWEGETELAGNTILRYSDTQIPSLLVSTTIMWAHIQRIFNQARKMNRKKYKLETPSIMSCPKWVLTLQIEMLITRSDTELNISGRAGDCDELDPFYNPYKGDNSIWCWHTTTHNTITSINRGLNLRQQSSHNAQTPIYKCQSVSPISKLSSHLVESHNGLHWPQTTCSSCLRAESQESCDPWPGN